MVFTPEDRKNIYVVRINLDFWVPVRTIVPLHEIQNFYHDCIDKELEHSIEDFCDEGGEAYLYDCILLSFQQNQQRGIDVSRCKFVSV